MSSIPNFIIPDNASPNITFQGGWAPLDQPVGSFPNKLYAAPAGVSSIIYKFSGGEEIVVVGTYNRYEGSSLKILSCDVDGIPAMINAFDNTIATYISWHFCSLHGLGLGDHVLNFTVEVERSGDDVSVTPLLFENFFVKPSTTSPLANHFLVVNALQPMIQYSGDWINSTIYNWYYTVTPGSTAVVSFNDISLYWYNSWRGDFSGKGTNATWAIDQGPPTVLTIPTIANAASAPSYVVGCLFYVQDLAPGSHRLEVTYGKVGRPLLLEYLLIGNFDSATSTGSKPNSTPSSTISQLPTETADSINSGGLSTAAKISIGVNVTAGVLLVAALLIYTFWRKIKRRRPSDIPDISIVESPVDTSEPTNSTKGTPVTPQWLQTSQSLLTSNQADGNNSHHHFPAISEMDAQGEVLPPYYPVHSIPGRTAQTRD